MARKYKRIADVARERGKTEEALILASAQQGGSVMKTAEVIGVTPNAIRYWCQRRGLELQFTVNAELVKVQ